MNTSHLLVQGFFWWWHFRKLHRNYPSFHWTGDTCLLRAKQAKMCLAMPSHSSKGDRITRCFLRSVSKRCACDSPSQQRSWLVLDWLVLDWLVIDWLVIGKDLDTWYRPLNCQLIWIIPNHNVRSLSPFWIVLHIFCVIFCKFFTIYFSVNSNQIKAHT